MTTVVQATLLKDARVNCYSLMTAVSIEDYLTLVEGAYAKRGGLQFQRDALKTTSARRIRSRMVSDVIQGAILPPVVIGVVVDPQTMAAVPNMKKEEVIELIADKLIDTISLIDGMQRTTALRDAFEQDPKAVSGMTVRIEIWIAETTDSLIYRMLVLNTGQVPWNLGRQLQVVYSPLISEMKQRLNYERILDTEKGERRTRGGEYSPDSMAELYIAFGLRKTDIDTQETLADEFSRLDMTDALAEDRYNAFFYPIVQMMVDLDLAFSRLDAEMVVEEEGVATGNALRVLKKGKSIFDSKPARIGFVVAAAVAALGRIGMNRPDQESAAFLSDMQSQVAAFVARLAKMDVAQLADFLQLEVLSEKLYGQKRSAVGRYERAYFDAAFKMLIEVKFEVPTMFAVWRAP